LRRLVVLRRGPGRRRPSCAWQAWPSFRLGEFGGTRGAEVEHVRGTGFAGDGDPSAAADLRPSARRHPRHRRSAGAAAVRRGSGRRPAPPVRGQKPRPRARRSRGDLLGTLLDEQKGEDSAHRDTAMSRTPLLFTPGPGARYPGPSFSIIADPTATRGGTG